jgi:periplasmic protein CpxP/Spy
MMNEQPKSKVLIIIIGILLIANIIMLAFFMLNKHTDNKQTRRDKKMYVNDYLKKEIGFNEAQMAKYDSLGKQHHEKIRSAFNKLSAERKTILAELATADFSDSAINNAANHMHDQQRTLELNMLMHIKDIRNICTGEQRPRFDTGFYKIFGKRGETHKEK